MILPEYVITNAMKQIGKQYVFGAEAKITDDNPVAFDCSELVEWVCNRLKVLPRMPDGAENQWQFCKMQDKIISIDDAKKMPGTLVFMLDKKTGRVHHVGFSDGQGCTIEARGKDYGVGRWKWRKGWNLAAKIPGVTYP